MKKLFVIFTTLFLSFAPFESGQAASQPIQFYMGEFLIVVSDTKQVDVLGKTLGTLTKVTPEKARRINRNLISRKYSGEGSCKLFGQTFPVQFSGVEVRLNSGRSVLKAVSGQARVKVVPNQIRVIKYPFNGFTVSIQVPTILLKPEFAQAAVGVSVPSRLLGAEGIAPFSLISSAADFAHNGSIFGTNFNAQTSFNFTPEDSHYTFEVDPDTAQTVNLGNLIDGDKGVTLTGKATRGDVRFSYSALLKADPKEASYTLRLAGTSTHKPECGYELTLKEGYITHYYAERLVRAAVISAFPATLYRRSLPEATTSISRDFALVKKMTLVQSEGEFVCDLSLPETVPGLGGQQIILRNIKLQTDRSGSLSGKVGVPPFKAGPTYTIACKGDNAWVFFDNWAGGTRHYPCAFSGPTADFRNFCKKYIYPVLERYESLTRPGLTVFHGEFIFRPPQAVEVEHLHTNFWGDITLTPLGVSGSLTSGGYSLVSDEQQPEVIQYTPTPTSLQDIIDRGDTPPQEPRELFRLADLRIMRMTIDNLKFCVNRIDSSLLEYVVHFPYPSHFSLEFADQTLDDDGRLHEAVGPLIPQAIQISESGPSKPEGTYNVIARILWFWRLPVVMHPKGVVIKHRITADSKTDVLIRNADLGIPRVFSNQPLSAELIPSDRQGVAFSGELTPDGVFQLNQHQLDNWFGKEKSNSFACRVDQIKLADLADNPASRDRDAEWSGSIHFPFFGVTDIDFMVRNAMCVMTEPLVMDATHPHVLNSTITLRVDTQDTGLQYYFRDGAFRAAGARYRIKKENQEEPWKNAVLWMHSFISAYLIDKNVAPTEPEVISRIDTTGACGEPKRVIQQIASPVKDPPDLVCHDTGAHDERNLRFGEETCVPTIKGTYEVVSIDQQSSQATDVFKVPNATYYVTQTPMLTFNNADAEINTDDSPGSDAKPFKLNIPGARLYIDPNTWDIEGGLSVSTDIGVSLPVEASSNILFALNATCGHFFIYGDMYIEYFVGLGGQLLISHIPFARLNTMNVGGNAPLDLMAQWAYVSKDRFIEKCFGNMDLATGTITGALVAGRVAFDIGFAGLGLGAGVWYFQSPSLPPGEIERILGAYFTAVAYMDLLLVQASISGNLSAAFEMNDKEIIAAGDITGCVCVSALIGHAQAEIATGITFSNIEGIDLEKPDPSFELGWGGCGCY